MNDAEDGPLDECRGQRGPHPPAFLMAWDIGKNIGVRLRYCLSKPAFHRALSEPGILGVQ